MAVHPEPDEKDKKIIKDRNTVDGKVICIIDNQPINSNSEVDYHHIKPCLIEEKFDASNIATVCRKHHKEIGQLSIDEYKTLKEMERFFKSPGLIKLDDVIELKLCRENKAKPLDISIDEGKTKISVRLYGSNEINEEISIPLSTCPSTGFKYFYMVLPVEYINNDIELQPRPLELKRLWELYQHLIVNSQLTPSLCRLADDRILLFDGQHKAAAQIWAGRKEIECKIYLNPAIKILKKTNLIAHDKLRQMPFFTSVLINKWASIFSEEWRQYIEQKKERSESGFISFLVERGKKRQEAIHMIESNIYDSILEDSENRILYFVAEYSGSDKRKPLTVTRLKQSVFKKFITNPPLTINMEESDRLRELERKNLIRFLNLISEYTLKDMWNPEKNDENHKTAERIYLNGSFKAWTAILKDVISTIFELYDENERREIFLREISEDNWLQVEKSIELLFRHRIWSDNSQENYSSLRISNENLVRKYLSRRGLNASWVLSISYEEENTFID